MKYWVPFATAIITLVPHAVAPGNYLATMPPDRIGRSEPLALDLLQGSRTLFFGVAGAIPSGRVGGGQGNSVPKGEKIYASSCRVCHDNGALGAPRPGNPDDWDVRLAKGKKVLLNNVLNGYGQMPAKGGRTSLTAREVSLAIDYMLLKTSSASSSHR